MVRDGHGSAEARPHKLYNKAHKSNHLRNFVDALCIFGFVQLRNECVDQPLRLAIATERIEANVNLLDFIPAPDQALVDHRQIVIVQTQLKKK